MQQIDTNKIKAMANDKIAYTLYERNKIMKKNKLKKVIFSFAICFLLLGGIGTVDAATNGKISNTVKNTIKVILIGTDNQEKEISGDLYTDENGDIWIKYKHETEQSEIDINKSELEKEGLEADIKIKDSENDTDSKTEIIIKDE
ncbi:hypothetical protein [Thomasclavelia cocleata]|uniref:hypothetical protein n=1 Tax=Thomasclavelia cocleata TaxID=69824 RepID=UPI00255B3420|nr:hypothetical protein [Thomasclavelia cocleata]